jgi:hypothetical protein
MDPDPDPVFFLIDLQDANKKQFFFNCLITFIRYIYIIFKDKIKLSRKIVGIKVFLAIFA